MQPKEKLILPLLILVGFIYRIYGLWATVPLWVDEFSTARSARNILQYGPSLFWNSKLLVEGHNVTTYLMAGLSMRVFGQMSVFALRLPTVFFGTVVVFCVYYLSKKISNTATAVAATLLTVFSYFFITWSRQGREYALLQALVLIFLILLERAQSAKKRTKRDYLVLGAVALFGLLTHVFFYLFLFSVLFYYLVFQRTFILATLKQNPKILLLSVFLLIATTALSIRQGVFGLFSNDLFLANNAWYYHAFLWREYALVTFLGVSGILMLAYKKPQPIVTIMIIHFCVHLVFLTFIFPPYVSRYLLPVFSYLYIGVGYSIYFAIYNLLKKKNESFVVLACAFVALGIIGNGDKFVVKPKRYYNLNHDFREIANIDYDAVYAKITPHIDSSTVIIETWPDRAYWYLGNNYPRVYLFHWQGQTGRVNGLSKQTSFYINRDGEKEIAPGLRFVGTVQDLQTVIKKYPKGFLFIDDSSLPKQVLDYAEKHLKKEISLDHYPLDDNPYSIWPGTLYSWGIKR